MMFVFDYSDKNNQVERFMETFRNSKAESNEVLYKNLMEILKQCTDFPQKMEMYPNPCVQTILLIR